MGKMHKLLRSLTASYPTASHNTMSDSLEHKSIQTRNQFRALRLKLDNTTIVSELKDRKKINKILAQTISIKS